MEVLGIQNVCMYISISSEDLIRLTINSVDYSTINIDKLISWQKLYQF